MRFTNVIQTQFVYKHTKQPFYRLKLEFIILLHKKTHSVALWHCFLDLFILLLNADLSPDTFEHYVGVMYVPTTGKWASIVVDLKNSPLKTESKSQISSFQNLFRNEACWRGGGLDWLMTCSLAPCQWWVLLCLRPRETEIIDHIMH